LKLIQIDLFKNVVVEDLIDGLPQLTADELILDVTAGNRMMWNNKSQENVVFLDKEIGLKIPPDIFGVWEYLPFRDHIFNSTIFDPPHGEGPYKNCIHHDPKATKGSWWGYYFNKRSFFSSIHRAQSEFKRVINNKLFFKWNESRIPLFKLMPFFKEWKEIGRKEFHSKSGVGIHRTYWVQFARARQ